MKILISNITGWKASNLSNFEVGNLFSPPRFRSVFLPYYALDNGAFISFKNGNKFQDDLFENFLDKWFTKNRKTPQWIVCPDVVGDKIKTLENWYKWKPKLAYYNTPLAFAVQDGMTKADVPNTASIIFVGGSTEWKVKTIPYWTAHFSRVHVARVNGWERLWRCYLAGAESVDGTGYFRGGWDSPQSINIRLFLRWQDNPVESWREIWALNPSQRKHKLWQLEKKVVNWDDLPLFAS